MQEHIIQLLKLRDRTAISQLYDAYGSALYGFALRQSATEERAQKIIQDTFLKVWHMGEDYDEAQDSLFRWIMKIAHTTARENDYQPTFQH